MLLSTLGPVNPCVPGDPKVPLLPFDPGTP